MNKYNPQSQYQTDYSSLYSKEIKDEKSRIIKAKKTLSIIEDSLIDQKLSEKTVLEIGCFTGEISIFLSSNFKKYFAIDIDKNAIQIANSKIGNIGNISFEAMNAENLSYPDDSFDIVICSHIYEHVPNPDKMMSEIHRILKRGGICYFAAGNRFQLIEPHHRLPLLSVLPKGVANLYLRLFKKIPRYYETHYTLGSLKKLVKNFKVTDYTIKIIENPEKFFATDMINFNPKIRLVISFLIKNILYWLSPTYIWILTK